MFYSRMRDVCVRVPSVDTQAVAAGTMRTDDDGYDFQMSVRCVHERVQSHTTTDSR